MDIYELVKQVGGEIVRGNARVRLGSEYVVLGRINGRDMVFTEEGRKMADDLQAKKPAAKPAPKPAPKAEETAVAESDGLADLLSAIEDK